MPFSRNFIFKNVLSGFRNFQENLKKNTRKKKKNVFDSEATSVIHYNVYTIITWKSS